MAGIRRCLETTGAVGSDTAAASARLMFALACCIDVSSGVSLLLWRVLRGGAGGVAVILETGTVVAAVVDVLVVAVVAPTTVGSL